ncbi:SCO6745 family protein [Dactylosporangium sp. CS-033363]|uniref:SCO6745 family protein n=1 Tax=Dactylosporangium sp. CS-033363 TaxID=3239935 RepID=UPI003D902504
MDPEATARAARDPIVRLGAEFGGSKAFAEVGRRFRLRPLPLYFGGRCAVLGPVDASVVIAACGFFAPPLVREAWRDVLATHRLPGLVAADARCCATWARDHLRCPDPLRAADLTTRAVAAAPSSGRVLFAAWRAVPDPFDDPISCLGVNLLRLREHRGGGHLMAVLSAGLSPLDAILTGPGGEAKALSNGWLPPYPAPPEDAVSRLAEAVSRTDVLAAGAFAALSDGERGELVKLLAATTVTR